jgi:phosphoglycolate phosphatase
LRPLLLLWDIDGTLLQRASAEYARALRTALEQVHGVASLDGLKVEAAGRTDGAIARDLLAAAGVPRAEADVRAAEVRAVCARLYLELCPADLSDRLAPGVPQVLAELATQPQTYRFSLVTGNYEDIARVKLERAGIGGYFPAGQGAFGSDHLSRAQLPAIARRRAGSWPRERTVVIGDTPRDIACARADRVRVAAVATGPFAIEALADADAVVEDAHALPAVLADWAARA